MASTSTSSSSSRSSSILDDPSNPLYLHHGDSHGAMLVYQPLVGENYPTWARSMQMALIAKNKLGFIDGTLTLSSPMVKTPSTIQAWIRCNKIVASWILNSISQEISTSIICTDTALEIWNNLKERHSQGNRPRVFQLQKDIADKKLSDLQHQDLVMQFLVGLNDSYAQVRAQILLMDPLPSINELYSLLIQEERQCSVGNNFDLYVESTTLVTKVSSSSDNHNTQNFNGETNPTCSHCGMMGHIVEKCYKIHDYPNSFKLKEKKPIVVHRVNLQDEQVENNSTSASASTSFSFTQEQCQHFLAMLGTPIQSGNFDFANKEVHMASNVIQPVNHSTCMAEFAANNSSDPDSWIWNGKNPTPDFPMQLSNSSLFPAYNSDTETYASSESNEIPPNFSLYSNSIMSLFPPARSPTDSVSENDEINPSDPSISALSTPRRRTIQTSSFRDVLDASRAGSERKHGSNRGVNDSANNSTHGREAESVKFNIEEILKAMGNFSPSFKIGQGGFATVYKGRLKDGTLVAVKCAKKSVYDKHLEVEFQSETRTLAKVKHLNLVKFYGYLEHGDERIVVVEYVPNGTLREHLDCIRGNILSLVVRLDIAIDVAHAITYLHMYTDHPIIHRDIKSSNILLSENFRAKIADFGFATLATDYDSSVTHVSTQVKGTAGYLDPEYLRTYQLTEKSDVHSFGVLLVELVTGRRPIQPKRELKERITAKWAMKKFTDGEAISTLDPKLACDAANNLAVDKILELALQCLAPRRQNRPSMRRSAEILWQIRKEYREALASDVSSLSSYSMSTSIR
ncbi:hypothetical protein ACB092_11G010400 [Castanea dentata]